MSKLDVTTIVVCRMYVTKNWLHNATDILGGYRMLQCVVNLVKKLRTAEENGLPCYVKQMQRFVDSYRKNGGLFRKRQASVVSKKNLFVIDASDE